LSGGGHVSFHTVEAVSQLSGQLLLVVGTTNNVGSALLLLPLQYGSGPLVDFNQVGSKDTQIIRLALCHKKVIQLYVIND
jgi:hypothetical protein